jgi:hypothetical protein
MFLRKSVVCRKIGFFITITVRTSDPTRPEFALVRTLTLIIRNNTARRRQGNSLAMRIVRVVAAPVGVPPSVSQFLAENRTRPGQCPLERVLQRDKSVTCIVRRSEHEETSSEGEGCCPLGCNAVQFGSKQVTAFHQAE